MNNKKIIQAGAGQKGIVSVKRWMIDFCEDIPTAILLDQLIFWDERKSTSYIVKSYAEFTEELGLTRHQLVRSSDVLKRNGWITTTVKKSAFYSGNTVVHYQVTDKAYDDMVNFITSRNTETVLPDSPKPYIPYTEVTTEVTTKDNASSKPLKAKKQKTQEQPQEQKAEADYLPLYRYAEEVLGVQYNFNDCRLMSDDIKAYGLDAMKEAVDTTKAQGKGAVFYSYLVKIAKSNHAKKMADLEAKNKQSAKNEAMVLKINPVAPVAPVNDDEIDNLFS